ncbi:hypothetical protein Rhopal_007679-T1 [Rhodotorula paludigena]|uniref:Uncharacterized protein n=1 Tax=Rhodotorula paludigena TaxID=86838 RepID=A0AAV5GQC6_9BASI|nr:hypothetical protein Rhopal_007679-T1 [Rhodotorula paludigena]
MAEIARAPPAPSLGSPVSSSPTAASAPLAEPSYLPGWDDATSPNFLLDYGGSEDDEPTLKTPLFRDPTPFPRIKIESDDEDDAALLKDPSSAGIGDENAGAGELTSSTSSSSLSTPPSSIASSPPSPSSPSQPNVRKDSIKNVRFRVPAKAPTSPPSSSGDSPAISFRSLSLIDRIAPLASAHPTNVPTSVSTSSKGKGRKKKVPRGHKAGKRSKKSLLERIGPQVE